MFYSESLVGKLIDASRISPEVRNYFFSNELLDKIKKYNIESLVTHKPMSFYDVFIFGMNIGSCGLTARHFVKMTGDYDNYRLIYGSADILVGTKKYNENVNFPHVWVETSEWLYDTTMMLKIPLHYAKEALGYETRKIIAKESAKIFSDNEDYYDLSILLNGNKEEIADYFASALKIG